MGFEPTVRASHTHAFQACSFGHSDTLPKTNKKAHKKVFCVLAVISKINEGTTSSSGTNIFVPYAILF